ncbi:MAG TPA: XdhC family protein [Rhizomicrobium sp.]|jgi:xanthine/CO dehydrogenase XdhC/CoxF family maturation factor|nr:XdhC family protein [Rhizomicrobium sp.]
MSADDDVFEIAERWLADGHRVALATVVRTWGSAPRPAGSSMAISDDGAFVGSVSGGCVEGAVVEAAAHTIRTGSVRDLHFGVADEIAWSVGLACGGQIQIYLEPIT